MSLALFAPPLASGARQAQQEAADYAAHFNRGDALMKQMRFHEAIEEFREATRLNPGHLPSHQALVVAYVYADNFAMAWKEVRLLRGSNVEPSQGLLEALSSELSEAEAARKLESIEKNLAEAQKAADEQPRNPKLRARLAGALENAGDYEAAGSEAERALLLDPGEPEAHLVLGRMLAGEPPTSEQAIPHLKMYLQKAPRTPENAKDLARAYRMLGDLYGRTGREPQAVNSYEEGLRAAPDEATILNNAAWLYATAQDASLRNPEKALAYARKAVDLTKGQRANVLDTLAEALYANGRFDEAIETEKKAQALAPASEFFPDQIKKFERAKEQAKPARP